MTQSALCPCGSEKPETSCCAPFHAGTPAPTALALMRSRYSAYVRANIDYIVDTHDPATRADVDRKATEDWARGTQWTGLEIVATDKGGESDDAGMVEFIARGQTGKHGFAHHERSTFRKVDGRWFYVDGITPKSAPVVKTGPDIGRNDPCHCGSGKKFKRCHGA